MESDSLGRDPVPLQVNRGFEKLQENSIRMKS